MRTDLDAVDLAELRRRDIADWKARHKIEDDDDWYFGPSSFEAGRPDVLVALVAGTVCLMCIIGVFATLRWFIGLFF